MSRQFPVFLTLLAFLGGCGDSGQPGSFDLLVINGSVYDGSLQPPASTNIGIRDGRIVSMSASADAQADRVVDAAGLVVVPGFIDPHTHATEDLLSPETSSNTNFLMQGVSTVFIGVDGNGVPDRDQSLDKMRSHGIGTNVGFYVGHEPVREAVMGLENRFATDDEVARMRELVAEGMRAGALGLSTGLFYTPGAYADTAEVIELAREAAAFGGVYDSHMRDESSYNIGVLGSIRELVEIGEKASIPVHAAHLKALGRDVWGQSGDIVALVEAARERGVEVTADQYPYRASGTRFRSSLVPDWVRADSEEAMYARLENPDLSDRIREEMEANLWRRGGEDSFLVTGESEWRGMTLGEIAESMDLDPIDAAIEVIRSGNPSVASFNMNPDDISALAIQPWMMTGSDGSTGHPRKYGTYPQAYRNLVVDSSLMSFGQFVHRSTGLVADSFRLCDRGYLREGRNADIAVIDLAQFEPMADFQNPTELARGVSHLVVNGVLAVDGGVATGELAGQIIDFQNLECNQ